MDAYSLLEMLIVSLVVGLSAWSVLRPWLRKRGAAVTQQSGCGNKTSACGGCSGGGCGSSTTEKPIRFHN